MGTVVLVGGDLMARARLEQAVSQMGFRLATVSLREMVEAVKQHTPDVLVLDLDAGREKMLQGLETLRDEGAEPGRVVGFFSHVDEQLARAARQARCEAVPRGRFWRTLPELLVPKTTG